MHIIGTLALCVRTTGGVRKCIRETLLQSPSSGRTSRCILAPAALPQSLLSHRPCLIGRIPYRPFASLRGLAHWRLSAGQIEAVRRLFSRCSSRLPKSRKPMSAPPLSVAKKSARSSRMQTVTLPAPDVATDSRLRVGLLAIGLILILCFQSTLCGALATLELQLSRIFTR